MTESNLTTIEQISGKIFTIRGIKVMLDRDLAELYQVETRVLNQSVKRNLKRFPNDFMFQLSKQEFNNLMSQIVTSKTSPRGGVRKMPFAFTEQGVAMLSGILNSDRAIQVNKIMRTFTKIRYMLTETEELKQAIQDLKNQTDEKFEIVFTVLDQLLSKEEHPKSKIGF